MILISKELLDTFKRDHPDAASSVDAWTAEVERAMWQTPHDLLQSFPSADIPGDKQAIFNIRGNRYRLWVKVAYNNGIVFVKAIGTHEEYDRWEIK
jgi:mRNA interferase HigB